MVSHLPRQDGEQVIEVMRHLMVKSIVLLLLLANVSMLHASKEPKLKLVQAYVGIGNLYEDQKSTDLEILYTNTGDSPLYLTEIKTFCPCVETSFSEEGLAVGDTAVIKVHYTFNYVGEIRHSLRIFYNSENPEECAYATFYGEIMKRPKQTEEVLE